MRTIEEARAADARAKAAFFAGTRDKHPHGASARIIPGEMSSRANDATDHRFSEWGNAASADHEQWLSLPRGAVRAILLAVKPGDRGDDWRRLMRLAGLMPLTE